MLGFDGANGCRTYGVSLSAGCSCASASDSCDQDAGDAESFWQADPSAQNRALRAMADAEVVAVIAEPPNRPVPAGWRTVGDTNYLVYMLR
jgi:hypothetical protein